LLDRQPPILGKPRQLTGVNGHRTDIEQVLPLAAQQLLQGEETPEEEHMWLAALWHPSPDLRVTR
jgi:hypothetical protein